jgi:hypothetical protein
MDLEKPTWTSHWENSDEEHIGSDERGRRSVGRNSEPEDLDVQNNGTRGGVYTLIFRGIVASV